MSYKNINKIKVTTLLFHGEYHPRSLPLIAIKDAFHKAFRYTKLHLDSEKAALCCRYHLSCYKIVLPRFCHISGIAMNRISFPHAPVASPPLAQSYLEESKKDSSLAV